MPLQKIKGLHDSVKVEDSKTPVERLTETDRLANESMDGRLDRLLSSATSALRQEVDDHEIMYTMNRTLSMIT